MSPIEGTWATPRLSFPRVSGDEPFPFCSSIAAAWFSPRERG